MRTRDYASPARAVERAPGAAPGTDAPLSDRVGVRAMMAGMVHSALMSSERADWETPAALFERLNAIFDFRLDACASAENAKCARFFTRAEDGLSQDWARYGRIWMNPPYGRTIGRWMAKAYEESRKGCVVVALVHARTDTRWWHDWVEGKAQVTFLKGRLRFGRPDGRPAGPAPFPSVIVTYAPDLYAIANQEP